MTTIGLIHYRLAAPPSPASRFARVLAAFLAWRDRARSRRQLASLNDRLLRDIGVDRATASDEAGKPFWQG